MNWIPLTDQTQLDLIAEASLLRPQMIFKHSTRCSISVMAKNRLDRYPGHDGIDCFYLDLLQFRPISNAVTERFMVHHESPQVILIRNKECIYDESHNAIDWDEIESMAINS
jgi:bacillithiol system protein YtxJ